MAEDHLPAPFCPRASGEVVMPDAGSWISGPCYDIESVAAGDLAPGDTVLLGDGASVTVTDVKFGDFWFNTGTHGPGVAIGWRSGPSSGVLFRQSGDTLNRVRGTS